MTARAQSIELSGEHKSSGPLTLIAANAIDLNHATAGSDKGIAMQSGQRLQLVGSQLTAGEGLSLNAGDLNADGASTARAAGNITMQAGNQLDNAGQFVADSNLKINAAVTRNSGTLLAQENLTAVSDSLNNQGILQGNGALSGVTGAALSAAAYHGNADAGARRGAALDTGDAGPCGHQHRTDINADEYPCAAGDTQSDASGRM
ncbi:hypothetical protein [Erwinia mallotivora]|uniref:hypothetical protein n=1 Tax=Erwinia mallotivora TaxID=69222 RepID=UPI00406BA663